MMNKEIIEMIFIVLILITLFLIPKLSVDMDSIPGQLICALGSALLIEGGGKAASVYFNSVSWLNMSLLFVLPALCAYAYILVNEFLPEQSRLAVKTASVVGMLAVCGLVVLLAAVPFGRDTVAQKVTGNLFCMAGAFICIFAGPLSAKLEKSGKAFAFSLLTVAMLVVYANRFYGSTVEPIVTLLLVPAAFLLYLYCRRVNSLRVIDEFADSPAGAIQFVNPQTEKEINAFLEAERVLKWNVPFKKYLWDEILENWRSEIPETAMFFASFRKTSQKTALLNMYLSCIRAEDQLSGRKGVTAELSQCRNRLRVSPEYGTPIVLPVSSVIHSQDADGCMIYNMANFSVTV